MLENEVLSLEIRKIFEEHKGRYGSLRISKVLKENGITVNRKRVSKLMRNMKLCPKGTRYRYKRYNEKSTSIERPNLLNQLFQTDDKNKIWVGDITYIPTKKGILYLAVFLDIFSRKVSGWSMSRNMKDTLVIDAFMQAYGKEHPKKGLIVHTDQGSQFTSGNFQAILHQYGAVSSVSRKGNPYDNAVMESFFGKFKAEKMNNYILKDYETAKEIAMDYVHMYYNSRRPHSSLNGLTPLEKRYTA